jgi:hypothetical protein
VEDSCGVRNKLQVAIKSFGGDFLLLVSQKRPSAIETINFVWARIRGTDISGSGCFVTNIL